MTRYLLAAEADKIQDFVFRASHLREVSGASALLDRFCEQAPQACLGRSAKDVIVNNGGSFRLVFDSYSEAEQAGAILADLYYMVTGCSLSVAKPVAWDGTDDGFRIANPQASGLLRSAKRSQTASTTVHMPYLAFCASTGVEIAARFAPARSGTPPPPENYISRSSLIKKREREAGNEVFLKNFIAEVVSDELAEQFDPPTDAGDVGHEGGYDSRDYVAYLVADGNGMGAIFDQIQDSDSLHKLSSQLDRVVSESLVEPSRLLLKWDTHKNSRLIPVLPMILGGDDVFVLLPAKWSVSFAQEFCRTFERKMKDFLTDELKMPNLQPTMSAAVVICKSKHPFQLAHKRGEELLKQAKRLGKGQSGQPRSVVNFEVIVGNRLVDDSRETKYRPTLRPYWVVSERQSPPAPDLSVQELLDARANLSTLPQKRRAELRRSFLTVPDTSGGRNSLAEWTNELEQTLNRIRELEAQSQSKGDFSVEQAVVTLGSGRSESYWRFVPRSGATFHGNALPDVLDAWDYLFDLKRKKNEYKEPQE